MKDETFGMKSLGVRQAVGYVSPPLVHSFEQAQIVHGDDMCSEVFVYISDFSRF